MKLLAAAFVAAATIASSWGASSIVDAHTAKPGVDNSIVVAFAAYLGLLVGGVTAGFVVGVVARTRWGAAGTASIGFCVGAVGNALAGTTLSWWNAVLIGFAIAATGVILVGAAAALGAFVARSANGPSVFTPPAGR
jgi:hypothetical protein